MARLPNSIGAEDPNKPSRKIVVDDDFPNSFANAETCGNAANFFSNSCITHNSEEGIRGAQAVAAAIFLNRTGKSKADIKSYIEQTFGYDLSRSTDEIRPTYAFETACDKSVPESIICLR